MGQETPVTDEAGLQFDTWWSKRGWPLARRAALYPSEFLVRNICQIAYYQGRLDESTKCAEQTREQLTRLTEQPPLGPEGEPTRLVNPPPDAQPELLLP